MFMIAGAVTSQQDDHCVSIYVSIYVDDLKEVTHCFVGGESANAVTILQQPGVINWNNMIVKVRTGTNLIITHC